MTATEPPPGAGDARRKALRELRLAEFGVLRAEIAARSAAQHQLLALNMTALAAIGGFALAQRADPLVVLILPLVSCALGVIWHDHARNIENLGSYIKDELEPALRATVPPDASEPPVDDRLSYERRIDEDELRISSRVLPLAVPLLLLFGAFPAASLVFALVELLDRDVRAALWAVWAAGVLMTLLYLWAWMLFVAAPYVRGGRE